MDQSNKSKTKPNVKNLNIKVLIVNAVSIILKAFLKQQVIEISKLDITVNYKWLVIYLPVIMNVIVLIDQQAKEELW